MLRMTTKAALALVSVFALAAGGCDDTCEGESCVTAPIVKTQQPREGDAPVTSCDKMCTHVFEECSDDNGIASGDAVSDDECLLFCEGLSEVERDCLGNAPCGNLVICLDEPEDDPPLY